MDRKSAKKSVKKSAKKAVAQKKVAKKTPVKKAAKVKKPAKALAQTVTAKPAKNTASLKDFSSTISPLDDRVMIVIEEGEKVTAGGIIIPDTAAVGGHRHGQVVAVGRGHRNKRGQVRPLDLKIGDRVLLGEYAGDEIEVLGQTLKIVREGEVLGVVE